MLRGLAFAERVCGARLRSAFAVLVAKATATGARGARTQGRICAAALPGSKETDLVQCGALQYGALHTPKL